MWKEILMSASCLTAIILTIVGLIKTPFKSLKEKHKVWYRAIFFAVSLILVVAGSILTELYIVNGSLLSVEFACLILGTGVGVFGGYAAYENLPVKALVHKGANAFANLLNKYSDSKVEKFIGKVGMDRIHAIADRTKPEAIETEATIETVVAIEQPTEEVKVAETIENT